MLSRGQGWGRRAPASTTWGGVPGQCLGRAGLGLGLAASCSVHLLLRALPRQPGFFSHFRAMESWTLWPDGITSRSILSMQVHFLENCFDDTGFAENLGNVQAKERSAWHICGYGSRPWLSRGAELQTPACAQTCPGLRGGCTTGGEAAVRVCEPGPGVEPGVQKQCPRPPLAPGPGQS